MHSKIRVLIVSCIACLVSPGLLLADDPTNYFEIDGNSTVESGDDWNLLNGNGTNGGASGNSLARTFVSGDASTKVFTGGGSKDPKDIPSWKWRDGGAPDKNSLTNGYAAAYTGTASDLLLMFGADRFAVNGDSNIGFWFFQNEVAPEPGGTFKGTHTENDIFVVSAFTQGGGVSTITAYSWDPTCTKDQIVKNPLVGECEDTNLRKIFDGDPNNCNDGCATVNNGPINVSWPYQSKAGDPPGTMPTGAFYEGGLDVDGLLSAVGTELTCLSSFLIETRSSASTDAVLKDFIWGTFEVCGMDITKSCVGDGEINNAGTSINYDYTGTVKNTGAATLYNVTIVDMLPTGSSNASFDASGQSVTCPTGSPPGAVCADYGNLAPGATLNWSISFDSNLVSAQNKASARASTKNTNPGACSSPDTVCTVTGEEGVATCTTTPTNSLTVTKNCGVPKDHLGVNDARPGTQLVTAAGYAVVQVNFSGEVCNTGETALTGITLTDSPAADRIVLVDNSLAPNECAKYAGSYRPSGVDPLDLGEVGGRYSFSDTIKVTGATATFGGDPVPEEGTCTGEFLSDAQACASATCAICE